MEDLDRVEEEIRRRHADWSFIERQPAKIKAALEFYIKFGDEYKAAKLANLTLDAFEDLRIKARIPKVVWRS